MNRNNDRVVFFDNLRLFLVVCVVFQHVANAYNGLDWWPVAEAGAGLGVDWLAAVLDAFTMPLLFYVAGYFAVPTMEKRGFLSFVKGKLKRLGLPWLIILLTICPILPLVYHYTRDGMTLSASYWEVWLDLFRNALRFEVGLINSTNELMITNGFYQRYMWFLSVLIPFFLIFAVIYGLKRSWFARSALPIRPEPRSGGSTLKLLLGVGALTSVLSMGTVLIMFALTSGMTNPEPLVTLGNVIQFRLARMPLFIIYFGLGIATYKYRWVERGRFPGHLGTWLAAFIGLLIPFLAAHYQMRHGPENLEELFGGLYFLVLNFLTMVSLGLFASLAARYFNRPTPLNRNLTANSYNLYLTHYPFVIGFQLLLAAFPGTSSLAKFGLVAALSLACAYLASEFLLRRHPKATAATAFGLLALMVLVIRV